MTDRPPFSSPGSEASEEDDEDWPTELTAVQEPLFAAPEPGAERREPSSRRGSGHRPPSWSVVAVAAVAALVGGLLGGLVATHRRNGSAAAAGTGRSLDVRAVLGAVAPSIVAVRSGSVGLGRYFDPVAPQGVGTGFVLASDGLIVTDDDVVAGAGSPTVTLSTGRSYRATVLAHDGATGLAVLRIGAQHLSPVTLGSSNALHVGDPVVAVGDALALPDGPTVSTGVVAALDRSITAASGGGSPEHLDHLIETDAAIDAGTSGGPLVDASGDVVGIAVDPPGEPARPGFALAISDVQPVLDELSRGVSPVHAVVGVQTVDVTPELARQLDLSAQSGALVAAVEAGSPAARAGVRVGDVVVRFDKTEIATGEDLARAVERHDPGDQVRLGLVRGTRRLTTSLRLGRPA